MHASAEIRFPGFVRHAIAGLGISQIIGWGSTYYLLSLLGGEIARDLGLSSGALMAGVSMTLIATALIGPWIGRWQDHSGSRIVMSTGSVITACGLAIIATAPSQPVYFLGWAVISLASPMILYSASFTAITQMAGTRARRAISYLTLIGGLASSISWPITTQLMDILPWRSIVLLYAGLNLVVCLPIHALLLDRAPTSEPRLQASARAVAGVSAPAQGRAFGMLFAMLLITGLIFNALSLLVFQLLGGIAFERDVAIFVGSFIGMSQVAARFIEMLASDRLSIYWTALISTISLPLSFAILLIAGGQAIPGILFAVLFGAALGLMTIARGGLTLAIFGADGYGERLNRVTVGQNLAGATAPVVAGFALDALGARMIVIAMLVLATAALVLMIALRAHCLRNPVAKADHLPN